eukprot:jgi/Mesvir1/18467/Mv14318-RA.1
MATPVGSVNLLRQGSKPGQLPALLDSTKTPVAPNPLPRNASEGPRGRQHGLAAARRRHSTARVVIKSITILCLIAVICLLARRQQAVDEEKDASSPSAASFDWTESHGRTLLAKGRRKHNFVTAFVVGCVSVVAAPFTVEARSFVRDVLFFLVASLGVYFVCSLGAIRVWQAVLFCVYYVVYVTVRAPTAAIISARAAAVRVNSGYGGSPIKHRDRTNWKRSLKHALPPNFAATGSIPPLVLATGTATQNALSTGTVARTGLMAGGVSLGPNTLAGEPGELEHLLAKHRDPLNFSRQVEPAAPHLDDWGDDALSLDLDVRTLLYLPFDVLRRATIPSVEDAQWNRLYATANVLLCPLVILDFCSGLVEFDHPIGFAFVGYFPLWGLVLIQSLILAVSLFVTTSSGAPPPHGRAPMVAGAFVMSIMWISTIANELLGCLNALGIIVGVSPSVLGVTVLAWGNSIGDLVADVAIARAGLPAMALSGCYAGPLFNMMVGLGLALTIKTIMIFPAPYKLHRHPNIPVAFGFLFASLVGSLTVVSLCQFRMTRAWGACLIAMYLSFTLLSILMESGLVLGGEG